MNLIDISKRKILFLGFGGVAKCTLNYLDKYFKFDIKKVYVVDKCKDQFYGPMIKKVKHRILMSVDATNFETLLIENKFDVGDIVIDLSTGTATYYFIRKCLEFGLNYINTSIEDGDDPFFGTSIDLQHKVLKRQYNDFKKKNKVRSNILVECGQNPGLIQHYVLYAFNKLNQMKNKTHKNDYSKETLTKMVDAYKVGTVFCSEVDNMVLNKKINIKGDVIYNTWSVAGLLDEGYDKIELSVGLKNKYIKPVIPKKMIDEKKMEMLPKYPNQGYQVVFLKEPGMLNTLNSVCPVINDRGDIVYTTYKGHLIHHAETFEMARFFDKKAPFMTYVYKVNKYAEESINSFFLNNPMTDDVDLSLKISNECGSFKVLDNINKKKQDRFVGHDSIGCTIFCGEKKVERAFWCGSILSDTDNNVDPNYTPTIIQVAAGVISGLSYILEPKNKKQGLLEPTDLDTDYILEKAIPLLGKFFFTEIPQEHLKNFSFEYKRK